MADKILTLNLNVDKFNLFISYIKELSLLDSTIVINIDNDDFILYSFIGKDINDIHSFKIILDKNVKFFNKIIDDKIVFIVKDGKKFVKNLQNFVDYDNDIKLKISYNKEDCISNYINISNDKLKLKEISGDPFVISKTITKKDIDFLLNKDNSSLNFKINNIDFKKIKNMSNIEITNDILNINIVKNELFIGENKWQLKIIDIDYKDLSISFPKKYFKNLNIKEDIDVHIFDNYILLSDNSFYLMIVLETSV